MAAGDDDAVQASTLRHGKQAFEHRWNPVAWSVAPGRLELLGNHVDYNGGLVLASAINRSVWTAVAEDGESGFIDIVAGDVDTAVFRARTDAGPPAIDTRGEIGPEQYLQGVIGAMIDRGLDVRSALRLSISGNVPIGFGMSSSAALCVSLVNVLSDGELPGRDVVLIAQDAEHRAGSPVGAMDQSASVAGGVILFDGATTSVQHLKPDLEGYVFAVANSGVSHALGSSAYPRRVEESRQALSLIREHHDPDLAALGVLDPAEWRAMKRTGVPGMDATLEARVDHVVSEVERVRQGVVAIETSDWTEFGSLMSASGRSSAELYEISHPLVEELVRDLQDVPGVTGARMMGGGEGGPALALIQSEAVDTVRSSLAEGYYRRHPGDRSSDSLQVCAIGPSARFFRE